MKNIHLNGIAQHTDAMDVWTLLEEHELTKGRFAVEIDGVLIPKTQLTQTLIKDGMRIEVVQAVGGG